MNGFFNFETFDVDEYEHYEVGSNDFNTYLYCRIEIQDIVTFKNVYSYVIMREIKITQNQ